MRLAYYFIRRDKKNIQSLFLEYVFFIMVALKLFKKNLKH